MMVTVIPVSLTILAVLAIIFGLLVLIFPKFLRVAVGLYLLIAGILQLINIYM